MKHIVSIFIILTFISCKAKQSHYQNDIKNNVTENDIRKIYVDSFAFTDRNFPNSSDSLSGFGGFFKRYYSDIKAVNYRNPFIYAFEEPYIDTTRIDTTKHWFRITIEPCFDKPLCLIIEKKHSRTLLTAKLLNGDGCYYTGVLTTSIMTLLNDSIYDNIYLKLDSVNFWTMKKDTSCELHVDGSGWTFELIERGKYHFLYQRNPERCKENYKLRLLFDIYNNLRNLSKIDKIISRNKSGV